MSIPLKTINLFQNIPAPDVDEYFDTLWKSADLHIERIISKGHHSEPDFWYDQDWDEWLLILQGRAKIALELQQVLTMTVGDTLLIPAHQRHQVLWTDPEQETIWLAVHHK